MPNNSIIKLVIAERKKGRVQEALALLADSLRKGLLSAEEVEKAGNFIAKNATGDNPLKIMLLGQYTTAWLKNLLYAVAWSQGQLLRISEGNYNNVLQELTTLKENEHHLVILLPWNHHLLSSVPDDFSKNLAQELNFWNHAWQLSAKKNLKIVQAGYDWTHCGAAGYHLASRQEGMVTFIRRLNEQMRRSLPEMSYFVDMEQISGMIGRRECYDLRRYYWTRQPFSEKGAFHVARHLWAGTQALTLGPKKVLVVDLDNTLWGGIVGERGAQGIDLGESGEAFSDFQRYLQQLTRRGILLAVASKNNREDAQKPFVENPNCILSLEDFAAFEASWAPKAKMLENIADALRLDLDSFVFFDDNPAEREHIRQAFPQVAVVENNGDASEYISLLEEGLWFEAAILTAEDKKRNRQYQQEKQRGEHRRRFHSMDDYFASLEMRGTVSKIVDIDMARVAQLTAKTNQFNLTTIRHSRETLEKMAGASQNICLKLCLVDRFGNYGLVSILLALPVDDWTLEIDTWLMSCRVIGRTAEYFFFRRFLSYAQEKGYSKIIGQYIPTKKNIPVANLYAELNFTPIESREQIQRYQLLLDQAKLPKTWVNHDDK